MNIRITETEGHIRRKITNQAAVVHVESYTDVTRPVATDYQAGESIWNESDNAPNFSDGLGNWRDATGSIT